MVEFSTFMAAFATYVGLFLGLFFFFIVIYEDEFCYTMRQVWQNWIKPYIPHIYIRRAIRKNGIQKEKAGVISPGPAWIGFQGHYFYTADSLFGLLFKMAWYYKDDRFLVG